MVPASDPKLVILVTLDFDEKRKFHQGGNSSGPVFRRIAIGALRYLMIPPDRPEELARRVRTAATLNDIREVGIQWAIDQSKELLAHEVPGIHYYTVGKAKLVSEVVGVVF